MNISALAAELAAGHPVTGAYDADAALAADELNALNIDAVGDSGALLDYLLLNKWRGSNLYGRLKMAARCLPLVSGSETLPSLPFGAGSSAIVMTIDHVTAANSLLRFAEGGPSTEAFTSANWSAILGDVTPDVISSAARTDIEALSQNKQSRATQLNLGKVRPGHVLEARG